eukprot:CAMPEP_0119334592 /NCGR_PEP_ID=MMETSP1333-20130426/87646_1 /TAXON_ID=418940 /ORGANISM="Scyphosphaera apsteinii, Strain RCC1455" /LENGTH=58 /DNA_ID=CAMNT_0007344925 /DNA_START=117 /DNA_END=290 /DNA_ORIENTATION=-
MKPSRSYGEMERFSASGEFSVSADGPTGARDLSAADEDPRQSSRPSPVDPSQLPTGGT